MFCVAHDLRMVSQHPAAIDFIGGRGQRRLTSGNIDEERMRERGGRVSLQ